MTLDTPSRIWVVVPAAGSSRRMGDVAAPKQYMPLLGKSVIEWSLAPFLARGDIERIVVVLAHEDPYWRELPLAAEPRISVASGGAERVHSVLAGLTAVGQEKIACRAGEHVNDHANDHANDEDWVLVHDAARPCLSVEDLQRLIETLADDETGGLLAAPVVDTLKRADGAGRVMETVRRDLLWRALTPQMFRYGLLRRALARAVENNVAVTDEAQAVEAMGARPKLVAGDPDNLKITVPEDLARAERILRARRETGAAPGLPAESESAE